MKVSIHGPNLADQSQGQFIVHAADSPDNATVKHFGGERVDPFTFDAVSREQCALAIYEDQIESGECDFETALADIHFGPSCDDLQTAESASPIRTAIEPQKQDAIDRAEQVARQRIAEMTAELESAGWDLQVVAPYPYSSYTAEAAIARQKAQEFAQLFRSVSPSRSINGPNIVRLDEELKQRYIDGARSIAAAEYEQFICKLESKCGEVALAHLEGNHIWGYSFLTVTDNDGNQTIWKTQTICNYSKKGTPYTQYPSRKVKRKR